MKNIGVDFHVFDGKFQGSRTHLLEIFSRAISLRNDYTYFFFLENIGELADRYKIFRSDNVRLVKMKSCSAVQRLCYVLPHLQYKYNIDILHTQYIMPIVTCRPCVVTIHDILFESYPKLFTSLFVVRSKILMKLSARRAAHIFTVSEYSKREIAERYDILSTNISVIYNGVDNARFFPGNDGHEVLRKRGFDAGKYILSVGRLEPRKNHVSLLKAYTKLGPDAPPLIIAGQRFFDYNDVFDFIDANDLKNKVHILEDVSNDELPALYRNAKLFVYPSWAEGFGIPPLEAMASGVPVICSNTTAFPEIVGNAAILVRPDDVEQLAQAVKMALGDPSQRKKMIEAGLEQSQGFTWENAARRTLDGYEVALRS